MYNLGVPWNKDHSSEGGHFLPHIPSAAFYGTAEQSPCSRICSLCSYIHWNNGDDVRGGGQSLEGPGPGELAYIY